MLTVYLLLISSVLCKSAFAQSRSSLEERVRQLEHRVEQLEKQQSERQQTVSGPARKANPTKAAPWRNTGNRRSLKLGMTEIDVRSILGDPDKLDVGTLVTLSYYDYPRGEECGLAAASAAWRVGPSLKARHSPAALSVIELTRMRAAYTQATTANRTIATIDQTPKLKLATDGAQTMDEGVMTYESQRICGRTGAVQFVSASSWKTLTSYFLRSFRRSHGC
jgi:hypothetical protein